MKKILLLLLSVVFINENVFAVTLSQALIKTYNDNLELNAERKNI